MTLLEDVPSSVRIERGDHSPPSLRWGRAVERPAFQELMRRKRSALVPMMAFYMIYFFGVMLLMGFARPLMSMPLIGPLNLGYALIIGTYLMCWTMALLYSAIASFWFDPQAARAVLDEREGRAS